MLTGFPGDVLVIISHMSLYVINLFDGSYLPLLYSTISVTYLEIILNKNVTSLSFVLSKLLQSLKYRIMITIKSVIL